MYERLSGGLPSPAVTPDQFEPSQGADGDAGLYGEVQKFKVGQHHIVDGRLAAYTHANMAVGVDGLLSLEPRFGLPSVPSVEQLKPGSGAVVNATLLHGRELRQPLLQFALPPATSQAEHTPLLMAKLGCALVQQNVRHVVTVEDQGGHSSGLESHYDTRLPTASGSLDVRFDPGMNKPRPGQPAPARAQTLNVGVVLPDGTRLANTQIGLWQLSLSDPIEKLTKTVKDLHEAAGDAPVAIGCRSGNTRSGAVSLLMFQRAVAESLFKAGKPVTAAVLGQRTSEWEATCKYKRSTHFADRMPPGLLKQHEQMLVTEFAQREAAEPWKPGAPRRQYAPPPVAADATSSAKPAVAARQPPPVPPKPGAKVPEDTYAHLQRNESVATPENVYGDASASAAGRDAGTVYNQPWDRARLTRMSTMFRRELSRPESPTEARTESASSKAGESPKDPAIQSWKAWMTGRNELAGELDRFLSSVAEGFCQEARQGLNPFAARKTYGVGKGMENVKAAAIDTKWAPLSTALHEYILDSNAESDDATMLTSLFKQRLQNRFDELPGPVQKKWVARAQSRGVLAQAAGTAKAQLEILNNRLTSGGSSLEDIRDELLNASMTHAALRALHSVGRENAH